jgi:hypothetical protein
MVGCCRLQMALLFQNPWQWAEPAALDLRGAGNHSYLVACEIRGLVATKCSNESSETIGQLNTKRKSEKKALCVCMLFFSKFELSTGTYASPQEPLRTLICFFWNLWAYSFSLRPCPMVKIRGRAWAAKRGLLRDESRGPGKVEENQHVKSWVNLFYGAWIILSILLTTCHVSHLMCMTPHPSRAFGVQWHVQLQWSPFQTSCAISWPWQLLLTLCTV